MSELDDSFTKLLGRQPNDTERQHLYRVRDALGLKNNDALWLIIMALQHYEALYSAIPENIKKAADKAASGAAAQAQADVNKAVAALVPSVEKAVTAGARSALVQQNLGKSAFTLVIAGIIVGAVFGVGLMYGARIFAGAESGHLTWSDFWNEVAWSLGLGAATPGLILLGFADFEEETTWWQWLVLLFAAGTIVVLGYRLFMG